jgi:hypothetical protein
MRKEILERYGRSDNGNIIIDISADSVEQLYNDYDRFAPYVKKELDADLVDYLIDSIEEIGEEPFEIRFRIASAPKPELSERLQSSIANYFHYLRELERRELRRMARKSLYLFLIGILFVAASIWVNTLYETQMGVFLKVFSEGLTVAGWVSLWESIAIFLINWMPHRDNIAMYERIATASLYFGASE